MPVTGAAPDASPSEGTRTAALKQKLAALRANSAGRRAEARLIGGTDQADVLLAWRRDRAARGAQRSYSSQKPLTALPGGPMIDWDELDARTDASGPVERSRSGASSSTAFVTRPTPGSPSGQSPGQGAYQVRGSLVIKHVVRGRARALFGCLFVCFPCRFVLLLLRLLRAHSHTVSRVAGCSQPWGVITGWASRCPAGERGRRRQREACSWCARQRHW
jgi:hypothetical protein